MESIKNTKKIKESLCKDCCYALIVDCAGNEETYCTSYNPPFFIGSAKVKECEKRMHKKELVTITKPTQEDSDVFFGRTKKKPFSFAKTTANNIRTFFVKDNKKEEVQINDKRD